jgi:hypothetical protein
MEHATQSWAFGDPTGWTIACVLFLLWSGVVGLGVYGISYRLLTMGSLDQEQRAGRQTSVVLGILVALAIFLALYSTSLSGFSQLDLRDGQLTFRYILPERTMVLPFSEVINVQEEPAYKSRWRLVLTTETSGTYESALASRTDVHRAGDFLRDQIAQPFSLHR